MRSVNALLVLTLSGAAGCYARGSAEPIEPTYPEPVGQSSGPTYEGFSQASDPSGAWVGPPGGGMDPGYGYEDPNTPGYPSGYADGYAPQDDGSGGVVGGYGAAGDGAADADAAATAEVTDAEIDVTLQGYGEWIEDPTYGRVWRPYDTVVGADFTPYESGGEWVDTDYGWAFASTDYAWGWLPFHYGRWISIGDSWCWMRDYTWGPGWVDWRSGDGYVGWRPLPPTRVIRDQRDRYTGPIIRDHRDHRGNRMRDDQWTFKPRDTFGRKGARNAPSVSTLEGLRATTSVAQPPVRGGTRARAASVMTTRPRNQQATRNPGVRSGGDFNRPRPQPRFDRGATYQPPRAYQPSRGNTYQPPRAYQPSRGTTYQPPRAAAPVRNYAPPRTYAPPSRSYAPPSRSYAPPSRPSAPSRSYTPPSRGSSAPSRSFSAPSRGSSGGSYSAPSRSSGSSSGRSGGSSSGGSRGGRHR